MTHRLAFILSFCLLAAPAYAAEDPIAKANALAAEKHYDAALQLLQQASAEDSHNTEIRLQIARVESWAGRYDDAEKELTLLLAAEPDNADIRLVAANLDYYRGRYGKAEEEYAAIVKAHPDYSEAAQGLKDVRAAEADPANFTWALDTGFEYSSFSRVDQPSWNNEFVQMTRLFNNGATAVHGRVERYSQFSNIDSYYEIGVDQRFGQRFYGYFDTGAGPAADYRPRFRIATGGGARIDPPQYIPIPVWATLDAERDHYTGNVNVVNLTPGIRIEPWENWALSYKEITVHQDASPTVYGWSGRLDGQIREGLRFYGGYANAPETVDVVTVSTISLFGGVAYDVSPAWTLHADYTRDNRDNSYIRNAVDASITCRF